MKSFEYLDVNGIFYILKNKKKIITTNDFYYSVKTEKLAKLIIEELNKFGNIHSVKTPISYLAYFSSNVNDDDKKKNYQRNY